MPQLKHSEIYRGGLTAASRSFETNKCFASVDQSKGTLDIQFQLASKGGGTTCVLLKIGKEDFQTILREIASKLPESAGMLSDCASIANKKNLEILEDARKTEALKKARVNDLIKDLEVVNQFVSRKCIEASFRQMAKEDEEVRDQLRNVIIDLKEL
jgi:hypothetical protein